MVGGVGIGGCIETEIGYNLEMFQVRAVRSVRRSIGVVALKLDKIVGRPVFTDGERINTATTPELPCRQLGDAVRVRRRAHAGKRGRIGRRDCWRYDAGCGRDWRSRTVENLKL